MLRYAFFTSIFLIAITSAQDMTVTMRGGDNKILQGTQQFIDIRIANVSCGEDIDEVTVTSSDREVALITQQEGVTLACNDTELTGEVKVEALFLGRFYIRLNHPGLPKIFNLTSEHLLLVVREVRTIDIIFKYFMPPFVLINNILFCCALDKDVLIAIFRRPFAPAVGIACQYVLLPLITYAFIKIYDIDNLAALGLFVIGIAPGGGASNVWTAVLDGDINLSIAMTSISNLMSFGMMPAWLYTLGLEFQTDKRLKIPFAKIPENLAFLYGGLLIGVIIQLVNKPFANKLAKKLKPFAAVLGIMFLIITIVSNWFIFPGLGERPIYFISAATVSWVALCVSGSIGAVLRFPFNQVKTIMIETAVQNMPIALMIIKSSIPDPEGDIASITAIAVKLATQIAMFTALIVTFTISFIKSKRNPMKTLENTEIGDFNETNNVKQDKTSEKN